MKKYSYDIYLNYKQLFNINCISYNSVDDLFDTESESYKYKSEISNNFRNYLNKIINETIFCYVYKTLIKNSIIDAYKLEIINKVHSGIVMHGKCYLNNIKIMIPENIAIYLEKCDIKNLIDNLNNNIEIDKIDDYENYIREFIYEYI